MSRKQTTVRALLQKYGVKPDKRAGQTFLVDQTVARKIVQSAGVSKEESVLEIGGGLGVLSKWLANLSKEVYIIEIEHGLVQALRDFLNDFGNVEIIEGDALSVELPTVDKVVSNLPYSISSEITFRLLRELDFNLAVLMYQTEFAQRLLAQPGSPTYSRLTVNTRYFVDVEPVMDVPADLFYPVPSVDSTVVRMTKRKTGPFAEDSDVFFWMIRGIYAYPNKTLRNALRFWLRTLGLKKSKADTILDDISDYVSGDERLRALDLSRLVMLSDYLFGLGQENKLPLP